MKFWSNIEIYDHIVNNNKKLDDEEIKEMMKGLNVNDLLKTFDGAILFKRSTISINDSFLTFNITIKEIKELEEAKKRIENILKK